MKMSPIKIEMVLHYYHSVDDYRGGDFSAPVVSEAINDFVAAGILKLYGDPEGMTPPLKYVITEKGQAYVELLIDVPFPVNVWMTPEQKREYESNGICSRCNRGEEVINNDEEIHID